jgi:ribonuclease HII
MEALAARTRVKQIIAMRDTQRIIAGVDEAGRGPLAGPVVAAAVILPSNFQSISALSELNDSKKLSKKKRNQLADTIRTHARLAIGIAEPAEIDAVNILNATMNAMRRAILGLHESIDEVLIDGNKVPKRLTVPARAIVGGDGLEAAISAASIIAKTYRDRLMSEAERRISGYGLIEHKGYGSKNHKRALFELGPSPIHRLSYRPVAEAKQRKNEDEDFGLTIG